MCPDEIVANVPVFRRSNPGVLGFLTGRQRSTGPIVLAQVQWPNMPEYVDIEALEIRCADEGADIESAVRNGRYGTIEDMRRRITYEKLQGTLTDIFYSMSTAQIDFLSYQFKPVLRFIESPTNRLLVADEVGLGKTIEAGLIWTECRARYQARRLLVICPPSLQEKWVNELRNRFQLDADYVNAEQLLDLISEFDRRGPKLDFVGVCGYHGLRPRKSEQRYLSTLFPKEFGPAYSYGTDGTPTETTRTKIFQRLLDWDSDTPFIDMVIFDEAHSMKNTASASHLLGDIISSTAGASLCLSATPIHNQSRDLYALLRLVDPDYFSDQASFDNLRNRNLPVVRLLNLLGDTKPDPTKLQDLVSQICASPYFSDSPIAHRLKQSVASFRGTPQDCIALYADADKLNLLGSFINRTRKVQVFERRVERIPAVLKVVLTPEERKFYQGVLRLVRQHVQRQGDLVSSFHLIGPALRMASCMPALAECVRLGRWGGMEELADLADDFELELTESEEAPSLPVNDFGWVRDYDFEANDSKYAALKRELLDKHGDEKVIIFAFFKDTLHYLQRRLSADGIRALVVTGDTHKRKERYETLMGFETDHNQVLLCSEVGAEGIDLQFCRVMVNYDLPWNPMRVEQRIGRIDRIGQKAKSIVIINFYMDDTIDGRIYTHLYNKLHIFSSTIGDLEGILGSEVSKLTAALLEDDLTPEQEEKLINNAARVIELRRREESDLEQSKGALIAHSDYLAEQIGESQRLGRFLKPDELRLYINDFFSSQCKGCDLSWDTPAPECARLHLTFEAWDDLTRYVQQKELALPIGTSARTFSFTLTPDIHEKYRKRHPTLQLVNHLHPMIRWITERNQQSERALYNVVAVSIHSRLLPAGLYFFLIRRLSLRGLFKRERLLYGLHHLPTGRDILNTTAEAVINDALSQGESLLQAETSDHSPALQDLQAEMDLICQREIESYQEMVLTKAAVQRAQVKAHFDRRIRQARMRLEKMQHSEENRARGIKLTTSQLDHLSEALRAKLKELENADRVEPSMDNVACGLLQVRR